MQVRSLGWEDPLEEGVATHLRILAWGIPWTGAWRIALCRVTQSQNGVTEHAHMCCLGMGSGRRAWMVRNPEVGQKPQ